MKKGKTDQRTARAWLEITSPVILGRTSGLNYKISMTRNNLEKAATLLLENGLNWNL